MVFLDPDMANVNVLFFPSNDTIADWMVQIYYKLPNKSDFVTFPTRKENADTFLELRNIHFHSYYPGIIGDLNPTICVFGNDWGLEEIEAILESRLSGIPTVAIQEGVILNLIGNQLIDVSNTGFVQDKYLNTDYFFCLGKEYLPSLNRENLMITGNPKFDKYTKTPLPSQHKILINCNFPYGVDEDYREVWINEVVETCESLNLDYFISKHPRDFGNIDVDESRIIKSSSSTIFDQIVSSSIVISRASTIIYEAIAAGRKVVYHNPGIEALSVINKFSASVLTKSTTKSNLFSSIKETLSSLEIENKDYLEFCQNHLGTVKRNSAELCANGIIDIINKKFIPEDSIQTNRKTNSIYDLYTVVANALKNLKSYREWATIELERFKEEFDDTNKVIIELKKQTDELNQAKVYYLDNISQLELINRELQEEIRGFKQKIRELNEARDWLKEKFVRIENDFSNY